MAKHVSETSGKRDVGTNDSGVPSARSNRLAVFDDVPEGTAAIADARDRSAHASREGKDAPAKKPLPPSKRGAERRAAAFFQSDRPAAKAEQRAPRPSAT